jgi:hypothetical protein
MKLIALQEVEFPTLGRMVSGEFEASKEEAEIMIESPYIIIKALTIKTKK